MIINNPLNGPNRDQEILAEIREEERQKSIVNTGKACVWFKNVKGDWCLISLEKALERAKTFEEAKNAIINHIHVLR